MSGFRVGFSVLDYLVNEIYEAYDGFAHHDKSGDHYVVGDHGDIGHGIGIVHHDGVCHPSEVGDHDLVGYWDGVKHILNAAQNQPERYLLKSQS